MILEKILELLATKIEKSTLTGEILREIYKYLSKMIICRDQEVHEMLMKVLNQKNNEKKKQTIYLKNE